LNANSAKYYYTKEAWDLDSWLRVISVEYQELLTNFPFNEKLRSIAENGAIRLLDVGCGTAIFPTFLDPAIGENIQICCDLLDVSDSSLRKASEVLRKLDHFGVNRVYQYLIEDIPTILSGNAGDYDLIWAIHSLTTVDIEKMRAVFVHLLDVLAPDGCIFIYQLTSQSAYQRFHHQYLSHHRHGKNGSPFMEYEDTKKILDSIRARYEVYEMSFHHEIPCYRTDLLQKYLRKCILDDSVDVLEFFRTSLEEFHDEKSSVYKIPQFVNFVVINK